MDELVHHCLRELSFDGDLGCNVSRLRDFIVEFYAHSSSSHPQTLDDAFCAFVWSLVVQQPTVRVGTIPPGVTSEVYIAPQTSAKRKAKAKGEEHVETAPPTLEIVPGAKTRTLDDLTRECGDNLRISVDPKAIFAAITGSHILFSKLSPMVYSALQIITRGRDNGATVVELGQQSKYDQKTCFYLVRQLTELDLVVKVRRGGVGSHFCIHKYFFDRNPSWRAIRDEETQAEDSHQVPQSHPMELPEEGGGATDIQSLDFQPIDARHLSSLPLVRARVLKLLKASRNHMHPSNNMLVTIGFSNPTKTDRRFFQSRIREMIEQSLIEKVIVPSNRKKAPKAIVKCFRLVTVDKTQVADEGGVIVQSKEVDNDEKDEGSPDDQSGIKVSLTIHKQIIDLLEESGTVGMTLNELAASLCQFDKRTIELLLSRAEKYPPPSHLSDLGIAGLMETSGRERRHRYFTVSFYRTLVAKERLDKSSAGYADVDFANVGGFAPFDPNLFYKDEATLFKYQDVFKDSERAQGGKVRKYPLKNPILPDGSVKQGRPRKKPSNADGDAGEGEGKGKVRRSAEKRKRDKADVGQEDGGEDGFGRPSEVKKRRPSKKRRFSPTDATENGATVLETETLVEAISVPKKRGRALKQKPELADGAAKVPTTPKTRRRPPDPKPETEDGEQPSVQRKRGRPHDEKPATIVRGQEETAPKRHGRLPRQKPGIDEDERQLASVPTKGGHHSKQKPAVIDGEAIEDPTAQETSSAEPAVHEGGPPQKRARIDLSPLTPLDESESPSPQLLILNPETAQDTIDTATSGPRKPDFQIDAGLLVQEPNDHSTELLEDEGFASGVPGQASMDVGENVDAATRKELPNISEISPSAQPQPVPPDINLVVPETLAFRHDPTAEQIDTLIPIDPVLLMDGIDATHTVRLDPGVSFSSEMNLSREVLDSHSVHTTTNVKTPPQQHGGLLDLHVPNSNLKGGARDVQLDGAFRPRVNVSHLRRENELYRVVENLGGIVNIHTKEFFEAHMALIESLTKSGEPTSAPVGTRIDKRTANTTFNNMESRGRIKMLKTSVTTHTGVSRPACIVYLPDIEPTKINSFLTDLGRTLPPNEPQPMAVKKIDKPMEYGAAHPTPAPRGALPLQLLQMEQPGDDHKERWSKNAARADQLFSYDDATIRDVLLTERTTLGQLYGFIVGKAVRARELHLSTLQAFENSSSSSQLVSRDQRIIHISYYCHDLPLSTYCSVISCLSHSDDLTRLLATEEGRQTLVRNIPAHLHSMLQIGRSRARSRFLDTLETLRCLKLVTPLQVTDSDTPWITCAANGDYPTAFDVDSLEGWTVSTPMSAPVYWHFSTMVPLHLWAISETAPPFWQDISVASCADSMAYWRLLQEACTNKHISVFPPSHFSSANGPVNTSTSAARSLRRAISWNPDYVLTWHQTQYLKRFVGLSTGNTPLQHEDGGGPRIEKISWVISAPQHAVQEYFRLTHSKLIKELEKARRKLERKTTEINAKLATEAKILLAKKGAEARIQRETDWDHMLHRVHPAPLKGAASTRVRRVRTRFLQSGSGKDVQKWEGEITDAIREANMAAKKVLNVAKKRPIATKPVPLPLAFPPTVSSNPPEKSIELLIAEQGPPIPSRQANKVKTKRKVKVKDSAEAGESPEVNPKPPLRRHRFQWNRDYEELARDASAIIKARCRNLPRLDWGAFEQVFPAVPRNTVRQRLSHIRETPGNEAYLNRLEDRWYDLWVQHRGTTLLPDDDPYSSSNFNLINHIEFLRNHVDKNAVRVGFAQTQEKATTIIPMSVDRLLEEFDVVESAPNCPTWDFMWNATVEEGREKRLLRQPFTARLDAMSVITKLSSDVTLVAESALKMALGSPHESYDAESASNLLRSVGEQAVAVATKNLMSRGILSKLVRDPQKQKPGRQLKISEINQNALGGSIPRDTFQDAATLEDIATQEENTWREWPILATDGDNAALIQLASDNSVEFRIDTSQPHAARPGLDWNSKKADDDQIETAIHFRFCNMSVRQPPSTESLSPPDPVEMDDDHASGHGTTVDDGLACCRRVCDDGLIDCLACLDEEWASLIVTLSQEDNQLALRVLTVVRRAGPKGVTKDELVADMNLSNGQIYSIVRRMTDVSVPLLFWSGYSSLVLVSSGYLRSWTVLVSESPITRIFPRRWIDIAGLKIFDVWEAALRAVIGVIVFRPGISQADLRWRLRSVYDRQEVNDLLRHLQEEGFIKIRCVPRVARVELDGAVVTALDDKEEKTAFWFVGDGRRHWYVV